MVKIRLRRMGAKKRPFYRVVVADSRKGRDGSFTELIGTYDPMPNPSVIKVNKDRALYWLNVGAQPTDTAKYLLEEIGAWGEYMQAKGKEYTPRPKPVEPEPVTAEAVAPRPAPEPVAEPVVVEEPVAEAAVVEEAAAPVEEPVAEEPAAEEPAAEATEGEPKVE